MWYYSVETELSYPICTSRRKRRIRSHVSIALAVFISAIFVIGVLLTGALSYSDGLDELRTSNPSPVHDAFAGCNGDDACCLAVGGSAWKSHKLSTAFVKMSDGTQLAIRVATKTSGLESIPVMKAGTWDSELLQNVIDSLAAFGSSSVLFDIGTHTAWFSLVAAYLGHRAITFESSESNRAVMGHSLCLASLEVQRRVVILPHELGARDDDTRTRALDSILINNEVVLRQGEQVVMKLESKSMVVPKERGVIERITNKFMQ